MYTIFGLFDEFIFTLANKTKHIKKLDFLSVLLVKLYTKIDSIFLYRYNIIDKYKHKKIIPYKKLEKHI